jgi:arylsulfatase A-like enzyme
MYEGGIREPLIIRWPQTVKAGTVVETPVSSPDFFPTILEATNAKAAAGTQLDGVSLVPVLKGHGLPDRALFWHYPHYGNQGGAPAAAMREGDWKLIEWYEDNRVELFNLSQDLSEKNDLASHESERVRTMLEQLHQWQTEVNAKAPVLNTRFDAAKPNGRAAKRPDSPAIRKSPG